MCLEEGGVLEVVLPGTGKMTYLGEGKVAWGEEWRQGETIQISYKMNFITFIKMLLFRRYFSAIF